jgi:hypothetical protein
MLKAIAIMCLFYCGTAVQAQVPGAGRRPVGEVRLLLVEAIDAPDGAAHGRLTGELVDVIGHQFRTSAPINVDVKTIERYAQEGCRRLSVMFWQEGVQLREGAAGTRQSVEFGINYCRNGLPPSSLARVGRS